MKTLLGIDIGGTNIKIAAVSARGHVLARGVIDTQPDDGPTRAFRRIHDAARSLVGTRELAAVGIACAGLVDAKRGVLRRSPNLSAWDGAPLLRLARKHFSVPVVVENDATSAAYGESFARGAQGKDVVVITLGTGVGGGIVCDGRVVRGVSGFGGEIGHITVNPTGPRCHCGAHGCLEAYAGSYGIVAAARRAGKARGRKQGVPNTARAVTERARAGDAVCRAAVKDVGEHLGIAVASLLNTLNPSVVVIAGGISASFDLFEPHVRRVVKEHAFMLIARDASIETSRLGNDSGVVGAAMLAHASLAHARRTGGRSGSRPG